MSGAGLPPLGEDQLVSWLRLLRTDGVGPKTFQSLLNRFGSAAEAVKGLPALSLARTGRRIEPAPAEDAEHEIAAARRMGARFVARGEAEYPRPLAMIDGAPPLVAVIGRPLSELVPAVAIVGSRNASLVGLRMAERLATGLGGLGYAIVSGLARGVDARAHEAALPTGTIAVLAGGLDRLYPHENRPLFERIAAEGAAVTEMPFGWEPRGRDFPRRNRIISGLALGTVVVEANRKSGSLITARFALEQGRSVFAVPGSPLDPRAEGPNGLIREGAKLVVDAQDVHEDLRAQLEPQPRQLSMLEPEPAVSRPLWDEIGWLDDPAVDAAPTAPASEEGSADPPSDLRRRLLELLGPTPVSTDDIVRGAGAPAREVMALLHDLEREGVVAWQAGGVALGPAAL